MQGTKNGRAIT
uniref:Uncharacterized protein n=1 Tax=Arundo donax TaxID=35708 RepID=A0A0A9BY01_ARUDO